MTLPASPPPALISALALPDLAAAARRCRICVDQPDHGRPLPHPPRPVFQIAASARICIIGQAPGARADRSGIPFSDPSGQRLRAWLAIDEASFYDPQRVAILPMGFCFPGLDTHGGDLPPRPECARHWQAPLLAGLPALKLVLLVGGYAQRWHLRRWLPQSARSRLGVNDTVRQWRAIYDDPLLQPRCLVLPHPSWRNTAWLHRNPWFESELLPELRAAVAALIS